MNKVERVREFFSTKYCVKLSFDILRYYKDDAAPFMHGAFKADLKYCLNANCEIFKTIF